jgi:hypothetical protein
VTRSVERSAASTTVESKISRPPTSAVALLLPVDHAPQLWGIFQDVLRSPARRRLRRRTLVLRGEVDRIVGAQAVGPRGRILSAIENLDRPRDDLYAPGDVYSPALSALMEILDEAKRQAADVLLNVRG